MEIRNITEKGKKLCDFVTEKTMNGEFTNEDLIQFIEVAGCFLNIKTISDYAKENNLSYNGAKYFRKTVLIFNTRFIIDND